MSTLAGKSDVARAQLSVYAIITWAVVIIAIVVFSGLAWTLLRYRDRGDPGLPPQTRGHTALEISWTIAPAIVLLVIAIPTIQVIFRTSGAATPKDALEVTVRGWQWWWEFRYPGLDVVTANELHVPSGRAVALHLEGPDVLHSFWAPQLGGKRDVVPGRHNVIVMTPNVPGEYWGQCAEFCGTSHANMRFRVVVDTPEDFERWTAAQKAPPVDPTGAAAEGKAVFAASACVGCHTIRGTSAGVLGPDLTHFGSRKLMLAGLRPNTPDNLVAWIKNPTKLKPGAKMPAVRLTDDQARALAAYLTALK
jgi:cytochrome c oxidase subunit II